MICLLYRIDKFLEGFTSDDAEFPVNDKKVDDYNVIGELKTADLVRILNTSTL